MTRQRFEIGATALAAVGAAFALQQATSVPGTWLMAGVYVTIAGLLVLLMATRIGTRTNVTLLARLIVGVSLVVALGLAGLAVLLCGPTVLAFDCRA